MAQGLGKGLDVWPGLVSYRGFVEKVQVDVGRARRVGVAWEPEVVTNVIPSGSARGMTKLGIAVCALWELRQEGYCEFKASLGCIVRPCLGVWGITSLC